MSQVSCKKQEVTFGFILKLFIPFSLAYFISCLLRTINNVLSPTFIQTFGMSAGDLGIMTSSYFLSFALAQIPLGVCLDKYSPGRTLAGFMTFGVMGCFVFASAQTIVSLYIGRALVGLGVSGCLMAAYKAFGDWLPREKLPMYNSLQAFVGGVGGMVATTPVNAALGFLSWRVVFVFLGMITLAIAFLVYFAPGHTDPIKTKGSIAQQLMGTLHVSVSKRFWRLAPMAVMGQASYLALNSLWIGPWFRDVAGYSEQAVPVYLLVCAIAISIGALSNGFIAIRLKALFGTKVFQVAIVSMSVYTAVLGLIILLPQFGKILWPLFVLLGPFSLLTYPVFSSMFDAQLSGRAQTTYNMLVFIASSVIQSGIGIIIDMFKPLANGSFNPTGYTIALTIIFALLFLSILWVVFYRRSKNEIQY
jgi:MFS family permease